MQITISRWRKGAISPLIFMVDDLANIFFDQPGGDWGGKKLANGGMYDYLKEKLLNDFPWVKFTFFLVTDIRAPQVYGAYDYANTCVADGFPDFLKALEADGHELAYHGTTHGQVKNNRFIQEWDSFASLQDAISTIEHGKGLYTSALNHPPNGGKYCGYLPGRFGHESILQTGFQWWFDHWDSQVETRPEGEWRSGVFFFPSNIDCSHYALSAFGRVPFFKYIKSIYRVLKNGNPYKRINRILDARGILTLQEHSSPVRTDNKIQFPNIVSDMEFVRDVLRELKKHNIWYATATEVYLYERARLDLKVDYNEGDKQLTVSSDFMSYPSDFKITLRIPNELSKSVWMCNGAALISYNSNDETYLDVGPECFNTKISLFDLTN